MIYFRRCLIFLFASLVVSGCDMKLCAGRGKLPWQTGRYEKSLGEMEVFFGKDPARCTWASLEKQDFPGAVDGEVTMTYLGTVKGSRGKLDIYFHDYTWGASTEHNTRRIVVLKRCKYIGNYYLGPNPVRLRGLDLLFDSPKDQGNVMTFKDGIPPAKVWLDGSWVEFWH